MRILILDDEQIRHDDLGALYAGHEVVHTSTYSQFVRELESGSPWDLIHLDHDLGPGDSYLDGWGDMQFFTGQHAAIRVCELSDDRLPVEVIVHSVNPLGANNMVTDLKSRKVNVTWQPYAQMKLMRKQMCNLKS